MKGKAGQNFRDHLEAVKLNRVLTEMVKDVELPKTPADLARAPYDRTAMIGVLDVLEIRNASLRERLLAVDPGAAEEQAPAPAAAGVELDASVLGAGELAPWLAAHAGGPLGVATVDSWALGQGNVSEIALAAAGALPPGSSRPSWTGPTSRPSRPGPPMRRSRRSCTTPRA